MPSGVHPSYKVPHLRTFPPASAFVDFGPRFPPYFFHQASLCPTWHRRESLSWVLAVSIACSHGYRPIANKDNAVSGLSAAHTIYLAGGNVVLLDKNSKFTH